MAHSAMSFRVIPRAALPLILRSYGAFVTVALAVAAVVYFYRGRDSATFVASVVVTFGAFAVFALIAPILVSAGVSRWKVIGLAVVLAIGPGALVYALPIVGLEIFTAAVPIGLYLCATPKPIRLAGETSDAS